MQKKHLWYRRRGYPHFDHPISLHDATEIVTDPLQVARHGFYPFIEFTVETFKVKRISPSAKIKRIPKQRPIAYASHVDSHIYSYYSYVLSKEYEREIVKRGLNECVLAFRSLGKSNVDFALEAFRTINNQGECAVIAIDITKFFDNLDHGLLKNVWATLLGCAQLDASHYAVFRSITKYSTVNLKLLYAMLGVSQNNKNTAPERLCSVAEFRSKVRPSKLIVPHKGGKGIPQGSPISALLSNLYMLEYDSMLQAFVQSVGGKYFRYCDDILIIVPPPQKAQAEAFAVSEIKKLGLDVNPDKTDRVNFTLKGSALSGDHPLQYLGFLYDGERILLRSASLARYSERMRAGVRLAKATMKKKNAIRMAKGESERPLFTRSLNRKYSYLGRRNFITYGYDAARKMDAPGIRGQLKVLWKRLQVEIESV